MIESGNIYSFLANVTKGLLTDVQLSMLEAETSSLNLWTNSNEALTRAQVSDPLITYDPAKQAWVCPADADPEVQALCDDVNKVQGQINVHKPNTDEALNAMLDLVTKISSAGGKYQNVISQAFMASMFSLAGQAAKTPSSDGSAINSQVMAALNATNSFLSSKAQAEEQPGSTEARAESSQLQTTSGLPSTLKDLAAAFTEPYGNIGQLLGQSFV